MQMFYFFYFTHHLLLFLHFKDLHSERAASFMKVQKANFIVGSQSAVRGVYYNESKCAHFKG